MLEKDKVINKQLYCQISFKFIYFLNRYKQVLANGLECQEKIFIVKSGEMLVWVKINKNHIRNYKKKLSKYHMKEKLPESNSMNIYIFYKISASLLMLNEHFF